MVKIMFCQFSTCQHKANTKKHNKAVFKSSHILPTEKTGKGTDKRKVICYNTAFFSI